jgi:hypothetical protein
VNFGDQEISAEVIGDCVSDIVSNTKTAQKINDIIDLTTSATNTGITSDQLISLVLVIGVIVIGRVILSYTNTKPGKRRVGVLGGADDTCEPANEMPW